MVAAQTAAAVVGAPSSSNDDDSRHRRRRSKPGWQRLYERAAADSAGDRIFAAVLLGAEAVLCAAIVRNVAYTEIDWTAYMEEVECAVVHGERDYAQIRGGTGPLVYPAGFVYLFALLRSQTDGGTDIAAAQGIFAMFYLATQACVLYLYQRTVAAVRRLQQPTTALQRAHAVWSWRIAAAALCCSKRLHSIYLLRLFNDGPTMLLLYLSVCFFVAPPAAAATAATSRTTNNNQWKWSAGCLVFSLAVSVKMNVLLFAPGLLLLLLQVSDSLWQVAHRLLVFCALPQVVLGAPFLRAHPVSYLRRAFELDRVFLYRWTVNWKFIPEETFVSKQLSLLLLSLHLGCLAFFCIRWLNATKAETGKRIFLFASTDSKMMQQQQQQQQLSPIYITSTLFTSNFIGICFARTLHYQFYSWYFHALPFLLWCNTTIVSPPSSARQRRNDKAVDSLPHRIILLGAVEFAFLTFPATPTSSAILQMAHLAVLVQIRPPNVLLPPSSSATSSSSSAATPAAAAAAAASKSSESTKTAPPKLRQKKE